MEKYKKQYETYYDSIINKVNKGKKTKKNEYMSKGDEVYPKTSSYNSGYYKNTSYKYSGSYNNRMDKKKNKTSFKFSYINGFIIRLIVASSLFLIAFSLKVLNSELAKDLHEKGKIVVNKSYGLEKQENIENFLKTLNIDYKEMVTNIEDKYKEVVKDVKKLNGAIKN